MARLRRRIALLALVVLPGCHAPDPQLEFELVDFETYWAVDAPRGRTQFLAPVARFRLHHKGREEHRSVLATAAFRRAGDEKTWGSAWERVTPRDQPLRPGDTRLVLLKSDARYSSEAGPDAMLANEAFVDASVDVFIKVGSSEWSRFAHATVERRIGSRSLEEP